MSAYNTFAAIFLSYVWIRIYW